MTTITRIGLCPKCKREGRPKSGDDFIVMGGKSNKYKVLTANCTGKSGYTPHIYQLIKVFEKNVYFQKICSMDGCGLYIDQTGKDITFAFNLNEWSYETITVENWNALVMLKDTGYEI